MRIALAGTGPLGVTLLSAMLDSPHEVVALLRNGRVATAVGKRLLPPLAAVFAPQTSVLAETPRPQSIHGRHSCRGDRVRRDVS